MMRHGTSLIELLVALTILGLTGLITVPMVVGTGRVAARATTGLAAERTTASLAVLLRHDLRLVTTDEIIRTTPTMLWLGRPVGEGPVCATTATTLLVRVSGWQGDRLPQAGRDLVQYLAPPASSGWRDAALVLVTSGNCPDGLPAMQLELAADPSGSTHLRVLEPARLSAYPSGGASWLGLAAPGDPIQPFAGPVVSPGVTLSASGGALHATVAPATSRSATLRFPVEGP